MLLAVCFVVFMILALCGGGYYLRSTADGYPIGGSFLLLWVCVAILGYVIFSGVPMPATPPLR